MNKRVYLFPNGFSREAEAMYGWLRNYNLTPSWGDCEPGKLAIDLPAGEVSCLLLMAEHNPARFGNASQIRKHTVEYRALEEGAKP